MIKKELNMISIKIKLNINQGPTRVKVTIIFTDRGNRDKINNTLMNNIQANFHRVVDSINRILSISTIKTLIKSFTRTYKEKKWIQINNNKNTRLKIIMSIKKVIFLDLN
jgi:hypothetical protein